MGGGVIDFCYVNKSSSKEAEAEKSLFWESDLRESGEVGKLRQGYCRATLGCEAVLGRQPAH